MIAKPCSRIRGQGFCVRGVCAFAVRGMRVREVYACLRDTHVGGFVLDGRP